MSREHQKLVEALEGAEQDTRLALSLARSNAPADRRLLEQTAPDLSRALGNVAARLRRYPNRSQTDHDAGE